jgi:phage nucleotide-binding protein
MALIKKPSELTIKSTLTAMIYGQPGIGKSTLACSAPQPVMLDFDGGIERVNGAHQCDCVQISKWEEVYEALDEIKGANCYKSLIIDTIGKMLSYMEDFIKRTEPKMKLYDGTLSLKGYGKRKQMFIQLLKDTAIMGLNIIFVAHETEIKRDDNIVIRPEISGSAANELVKELDLVGYMEAYGKQRTICFDPSDKYYAKNTCNIYGAQKLELLVNDQGEPIGKNDYLQKVIASYLERQKTNLEKTGEFEAICEVIDGNAQEVKNAEDANNYLKWVGTLKHVYSSKAVAWAKIQAKANELGLTYNKTKKCYEAA